MGELGIYRELLQPLDIPRPALHSYWQTPAENLFILEDVGPYTLDQQPSLSHFVTAARLLAYVRCSALIRLQAGVLQPPAQLVIQPSYYVEALEYLLHCAELDAEKKALLAPIAGWLPAQLQDLYAEIPMTLCHNDYHVKNLVLREDIMTPIDWAMAYFSPYLGDLFSLLHAAAARKVDTQLLTAAYEDELRVWGHDYACVHVLGERPITWQVALGAVCILLTSIRWTLTEARYMLPETQQWIPAMIRNIIYYANTLAA
ncbi:hypothetical protein KDI_04730 [Dictyobacter arantiisoli]|uniref:Aminoglycoside phosphotransferase domain-containing protein n=2 Tax=Dictyobacter arantiisoli TaxID=2014874 RepID=A0A5A5T7I7_9CHLR|nr:hypothetical protein KDI_04730 [Dictyobacter arantiisoli]